MVEKLIVLFSRKRKKEGIGSAFSQRLKKSRYRAGHFETGKRRKSLRDRLFFIRKGKRPHPGGLPGREKSGNNIFFAKLLLFSGTVLLSAYFLLVGPLQSLYGNWHYFRVHEIEVNGCRTISGDALRKYAGLSYEMNMLTLDPGAIRRQLQTHPWVKAAEVKRIWPDGLLIHVQEQQPQALVVLGAENKFSYLNSKGTVFAKVNPGQELDLPVITGIDSFHTEEEKKSMLGVANSLLRLAGQNNPNLPAQNISEIHFTEKGSLILYLVDHPFPIYFGEGGVKRKYYQLWKVLEVLYRKRKGKASIEEVAYIRMDYQNNKVLVARNHAG